MATPSTAHENITRTLHASPEDRHGFGQWCPNLNVPARMAVKVPRFIGIGQDIIVLVLTRHLL
jgi:hypothetical protein